MTTIDKVIGMITVFTFILCGNACKTDETFLNPYAGGKQPLGITFSNTSVLEPVEGGPGTTMVVDIPGAADYKSSLVFTFNGEPAEIMSFNGSKITVKVPVAASTGATSLQIGDQVFFGPSFKVLGKISDNPYFKGQIGTNGGVNGSLQLKDGNYILVGNFSDINNQGVVVPINRIGIINKDAVFIKPFQFGTGSNGALTSAVASSNDNNFFIAGTFSSFDRRGPIKNITRLKSNGAIDSSQYVRYSTQFGFGTNGMPTFNGGTDKTISKLFYYNNKIIAVGNFEYYLTHRYDQGKTYFTPGGTKVYRDSIITDSIPAKQLIKFNPNGSLDNTYHFSNGNTLDGGNGSVYDAFLQADGKLILVGAFSKFDNVPAGRIVRLNANGTLDDTFKAGNGANANIQSITWNETTKKFVIAGSFGSFNGANAQGVVLLNEDGSVDNSFIPGNFDNGFPTYAKQLDNKLIIVGGSFRKYNGKKRSGFMILDETGNLASGYNSLGDFSGNISQVIEGRNTENKRTVLILGSFSKFDSRPFKNMVSVVLEERN